MAFLPTNAAQVQQFAMSLYGYQVGSTTMAAVQADITTLGGLSNALNTYFNISFGALPTATVAANLVQNVGITTGAADAITYVKAILDTTPAAARGVAVSGILNAFSKMTGDAVYGAAASVYNNRLTSALNYTGANDVAVGTASPSQILPLTTGADVLGGTSGDDTFLAAADTLNPLDVINGGAGNNTLKIDSGADLKGSISNIQNLVYVGDAHLSNGIDASKVGGLQTVTFQDITGLHSNDDDAGVEINNLQNGSTVRIEGTIASEDESYTIIHANYAKDATVANLVLINADETDSSYIDFAATGTSTDTLKTLNVNGNTKYTSGSNNTTVDLLVGADNDVNKISTLNVNSYAGGTLKIDASVDAGAGDGIGKNLTTIDATASAGKTIIDITGYAKNLTYKGGASDDTLIIDLKSLTAQDSIVGGAGVDTLSLNVVDDTVTTHTTTNTDHYKTSITDQGYGFINDTGFEQVGFYAEDDQAMVLNMAKLTSSTVQMNSDDFEVSGVSDTDTFVANTGDNWVALAHARSVVGPNYDYTGNGVVNVSVGAGKSVQIDAVVLTTNDNGAIVADVYDDNTGDNWQYSDFAKLVLTGAGEVYFDNTDAETADTAGGATVDASAMTGTSVLDYTGNINQTDYVTLGAGKDLVGIWGSSTSLFDRVTGFSAAADKIKLNDYDDSWVGKLTIDSGVTTASGAIANALVQLDEEETGYFQFGGNTYVVEDGNYVDGQDTIQADFAIQLVGLLTLTASNTDLPA